MIVLLEKNTLDMHISISINQKRINNFFTIAIYFQLKLAVAYLRNALISMYETLTNNIQVISLRTRYSSTRNITI